MANIIMIKHGAAAPTVANLNDFELGYSINEQKLYIKEVNNGTSTLRSFSTEDKLATKDSVTTLNNELSSLKTTVTSVKSDASTAKTWITPTAAGACYAEAASQQPKFGTLPLKYGGTGITSNPSLLVKLNSTSAAGVFASSPRPGVTGTLPVANGGTGLSTITSGSFLVGNGTSAITLKTASEVLSLIGAAASSHNHSTSNITSGTLGVARGGTGITSNPSLRVNLASTSAVSVFAASPRPGVEGTLPVANGGTGVTQKYTDGTITWTSNANLATNSTAPLVRYFPYLGLVFVQLDFQLAANLGADKSFNVATSSFLSNDICALSCYGTSTSWRYDFSASILKDGTIRIANAGSGQASASNSVRVYITGFFTYGGTA